jgi:hypothetical protein
VTHLKKTMLEELQGRKSLCLAGLRMGWFDPIAEASEVPDHLPGAELLRSLGDCWAAFFVTYSLMQDEPDQSTLSMGDGSDSLMARASGGPALVRKRYTSSFLR